MVAGAALSGGHTCVALYDVIASFIVDYIIESQLIFLHPKPTLQLTAVGLIGLLH